MKRFSVILIGCIFVLSIHSPPSWSGDSWPEPDPSKEIAAGGFEFFDAAKSYRLAIEKERSEGDFEFDILLAQAKTEAAGSADGQSPTNAGMSEAEERAKIAEALANPLSYLWLMFTQNDTKWYDGDLLDRLGEDAKVQNTLLIQPVMSMQLTEEWKTILRPVIPINSFETVGNVDITTGTVPDITGIDFDRETGLGDIILWNAFSNQYKPPFIWGFGPTVMMPTATDDQLGTGKWSAGPMALAFNISEKWILGGVFQHWWSFAGDDDLTINTSLGPATVERPDVNLTDFQYVLRYRVTPETNIGMGPNIQYNWETDELSLPVGMGFDTMIKIGKLPVKIGAEAYYYVAQDDDFGPEWQLRLFFVPVLPSPKWSQKPLF
ncbi:MAG: hypothetical protein ABF303_04565 [Desulfobacterales bacterium]